MSVSVSIEAGRVIGDTIRGILGNSAGTVFFQVLEKKYKLTPSTITNKYEDFSAALETFFGSGRDAIERSLVVSLSDHFRLGASSEPFAAVMREILERS